jgi:hypothetical protein
MSVNEIRELENMNPLGSEGDQHFIQMNMTTLQKAGEEPPTPEPMPAPPVAEVEDSPEDDVEDDAEDDQEDSTDGN